MIAGTFQVVGAHGPLMFFENVAPAALSHGYLFTGPPGVGKKTFAQKLAQSLLCVTPKPVLLGYCTTCSGCTRVVAKTHPDLYVAQGQLKIGERDGGSGFHETDEPTARDLVRQLSLHSYAGGKRIFILGDAEFTREAANALLKFFEEPPPGVVLLITTSQPGRLIATIRSRLIDVAFPALTRSEIATVLRADGALPEAAERGAAIGNGNLQRAKASLEEGEGAVRDAAVSWFFAAVDGREADHSQWATRATLEAGLDTIKTLARDWLAVQLAGSRCAAVGPRLHGGANPVARARPAGAGANACRDRGRRARSAHQRHAGARRATRTDGARAGEREIKTRRDMLSGRANALSRWK